MFIIHGLDGIIKHQHMMPGASTGRASQIDGQPQAVQLTPTKIRGSHYDLHKTARVQFQTISSGHNLLVTDLRTGVE